MQWVLFVLVWELVSDLNYSVTTYVRSIPCLCDSESEHGTWHTDSGISYYRSLLSLLFPTRSVFKTSFLLILWMWSWSSSVLCCHTLPVIESTQAAKWWEIKEKNNLNCPHTLWTTGTSFLSLSGQKEGFYLTVLGSWVATPTVLAMKIQLHDWALHRAGRLLLKLNFVLQLLYGPPLLIFWPEKERISWQIFFPYLQI